MRHILRPCQGPKNAGKQEVDVDTKRYRRDWNITQIHSEREGRERNQRMTRDCLTLLRSIVHLKVLKYPNKSEI